MFSLGRREGVRGGGGSGEGSGLSQRQKDGVKKEDACVFSSMFVEVHSKYKGRFFFCWAY